MSLETIDFDRFPLDSGDRVLDLGCGEGRHAITAYMLADVEVVGLDLSITDLGVARGRFDDFAEDSNAKRLSFIVGSGLRLPFPDHSFDKIICSEVLEHIHDYDAVLSEIKRVLKQDGSLAVSVPRFGPEWICWRLSRAYHEVEGGHVRIFRASALRRAVLAKDMEFTGRHWAHALHSPYWWLRCLFWANADDSKVVSAYHRFLVWDLMQRPRVTQWLERLLNPLMGKSTVMYFANSHSQPRVAALEG